MPLILSIIIPVYNVENYLCDCIDSIISQKGNFEIILVDDGSTDMSTQICDEYILKDDRVKVIHKPNGGVSSARNAGLEIARGEWIWFVDGDDYVNKTLKDIISYIYKYNDTDLIQMSMDFLENGNLVVNEVLCVCNLDKNVFLNTYPSHHNHKILFKHSVIEQNNLRFTLGLKVAEDQEFQLKYMMHSKHPIQIPISAYVYRQREGSLTHTESTQAKIVEDTFRVLDNLALYMSSHNLAAENWINNRIAHLVRSLLFAASKIKGLNKKETKRRLNDIAETYDKLGFSSFRNKKILLARRYISLYFLLNKYYLLLRRTYKWYFL